MGCSARRLGPLIVAATLAVGCTSSHGSGGSDNGSGQPQPHTVLAGAGVDPGFVHDTDGSSGDRLAATVVTDAQDFWRSTFPSAFGKEWNDVRGFYSVDSSTKSLPEKNSPCIESPADIEGNSFYCQDTDTISWDRAALIPVLRDKFGDASVLLVLAHEFGHAVQHRTGLTDIDVAQQPRKYPTIAVETMADCYAGAFGRWVVDGHAPDLKLAKGDLDTALTALVQFRDPTGTSSNDATAHGDAFDRVAAFSDGYSDGARFCAKITAQNRSFTAPSDNAEPSRANLDVGAVVTQFTPSMNEYFRGLLQRISQTGKTWRQPSIKTAKAPDNCRSNDTEPMRYCPTDNTIYLTDDHALNSLDTDIGDFAVATMLASRYALAAGTQLDGTPSSQAPSNQAPSNTSPAKTALCRTGGYVAALSHGRLASGDLDEAVGLLLDDRLEAADTGLDRFAAFRAGFDNPSGGANPC